MTIINRQFEGENNSSRCIDTVTLPRWFIEAFWTLGSFIRDVEVKGEEKVKTDPVINEALEKLARADIEARIKKILGFKISG